MTLSPRIQPRTIVTSCLLSLLLLAVGCASGGSQPDTSGPTGPSALEGGHGISAVSVSLDESQLTPEVLAVAQQYTVAERLEGRVKTEVPSGGSRDTTLDVKVTGMRLRSNGVAIWWGMMAGADWVNVKVSVQRGGQEVKTFDTGVSTILGGFAFGGRETRVNRMVDELARRIAKGI